MKNKFLKILGLVAGIGLGLVIVFQVILAMNTSAIKSSSPTAVNLLQVIVVTKKLLQKHSIPISKAINLM